jgi:hypothetical protein
LEGSELATSSNERLGFCPRCGEYLKEEMTQCPKCGLIIREAIPSMEQISPRTPVTVGSTRLTLGAACLVISGLIGLAMASFLMANKEAIIAEITSLYGNQMGSIPDAVTFLVIFWIISGILASLGGYFAFKRQHLRIALMGGVFALGTFGLVFLEGSVMGLIGLVLIWLSRREFH